MDKDKWTKEHIEMLDKIIKDKYAFGPTSGMITNIASEKMNKQITPNIENLIFQAIDVKVKMLKLRDDLVKGNTKQVTPKEAVKEQPKDECDDFMVE